METGKARLVSNAPRMTYGATARGHANPEATYRRAFEQANDAIEAIAGDVVNMLNEVDGTEINAFATVFNVARKEDDREFGAALTAAALVRLAKSGAVASGDAMTVRHNDSEGDNS